MSIYIPKGYVDIPWIRQHARKIGTPFIFILGGRATGKTFGSLMDVLKNEEPFILMRRTQAQADLISVPDMSPIKPVAEYMGIEYSVQKIPMTSVGAIYTSAAPEGAPAGYTMALSTISNIRGFDASDVEVTILDEFIPERHERHIKNEGTAFLNAYETINRNRELQGRQAMQMLCLANANDLANPIFEELGLIDVADRMQKRGQEMWEDPRRGVLIIMLHDSIISDAKRSTALYRLSEGSKFEEMSLGNTFAWDSQSGVQPQPLAEYRPLVRVCGITIYRHKSLSRYYVTGHVTGSPLDLGDDEEAPERFRAKYAAMYRAWIGKRVYFSDYASKSVFTKLW